MAWHHNTPQDMGALGMGMLVPTPSPPLGSAAPLSWGRLLGAPAPAAAPIQRNTVATPADASPHVPLGGKGRVAQPSRGLKTSSMSSTTAFAPPRRQPPLAGTAPRTLSQAQQGPRGQMQSLPGPKMATRRQANLPQQSKTARQVRIAAMGSQQQNSSVSQAELQTGIAAGQAPELGCAARTEMNSQHAFGTRAIPHVLWYRSSLLDHSTWSPSSKQCTDSV